MNFVCVTPVLNSPTLLRETMITVLEQSALALGTAHLHYVIVDGASSDDTFAVAKEVASDHRANKNIKVTLISEKDSGMYEALSKGFIRAGLSSDIYCYITAVDLYSPAAFDIMSRCFERGEQANINWLTGRRIIYDVEGRVLSDRLPYRYDSRLIQCGLFGGYSQHSIVRESTFRTAQLPRKIDF